MAEDHLPCSHRAMASLERMCIPRGSFSSRVPVCQPWTVGRVPSNCCVGPQPSSQKSTLSASGYKMSSFLVAPLMRLSSSRGCNWKSNQNSLSLPAAHTGEAAIFVARSPRCSDMMSSGSLSIMTFSTMCFTGILFPAARFTSSSMRVSSQKRMESLFSSFLLDSSCV